MPQSILDHPAISSAYLFPQPRRISNPLMVSADGAELACYLHMVDPERYTLVHFHGNGEAVADYVPRMSEVLEEIGLNSVFVEYREYGGSTGKAQVVAMLGDGEAALFVAGLRPEKVIAFGRSIGSLYAIELIHRLPSIAGLILESGIADPAERFLVRADLSGTSFSEEDVIDAARKHFNHREKLAGYKNPMLIMHTENDGLVDISHAERNLAWKATGKKRILRFPFGDHNSIMVRNYAAYFEAIREFVEELKE